LRNGLGRSGPKKLRLVKGSHVVVPRLFEGDHAYILQNPDRRIVFLIPFEGCFTLIGTTDEFFDGDPGEVAISSGETSYLCDAASRFLKAAVRPEDVVWTYAGVRPLYDDASADPSVVTRDYAFELAEGEGRPPVLSVFGGKITTYRRLAEHALSRLQPLFPGPGGPWTGRVPLPGGDIPDGDVGAFHARLCAEKPWLAPDLARRLVRAYGTRVERLLGAAECLDDLGQDFGAGLTEREVGYLVREEWARTADDILWRRSKIGLAGDPALRAQLADHLTQIGSDVLAG
jgi:glycerol-3-phosphate dehydrogenase